LREAGPHAKGEDKSVEDVAPLRDRSGPGFFEVFVKHVYNHNRPHGSIGRLTPVEFEQKVLTLQPFQRSSLEIKAVA
jgi:hypothetical protein